MSGERLIKVCACGRGYTRAAWEDLPGKAVYALDADEVHEQRRCHCGSHIVVIVEEAQPVA